MARDVTLDELKAMGLPRCLGCRQKRLGGIFTQACAAAGGNVEVAEVVGLIIDGVDITAEV